MKLSDLIDTPSDWSRHYEEVEEFRVCSYSTEYSTIKSKLRGQSSTGLKKITRVQNSYLYNRYLIRKLEYESLEIPFQERQLFHATAASKIPSIIKDNLDWRLVSRAKFGQGVSFSDCPVYANTHCARSNGSERAMIIAKVLIGNEEAGDYSTTIPSKGCDTTYGRGDSVLVKYYDDEFYPEYVAYYSNSCSINLNFRGLRIY